MNRMTAAVVAATLMIGLSAGVAQARDGWDRQGPKSEHRNGIVVPLATIEKTARREGTATVYGWTPGGPATTGAPYRVVKAHMNGVAYQVVARGRINQHTEQATVVRFPKAQRPKLIQVYSRGRLVNERLVRLGWD